MEVNNDYDVVKEGKAEILYPRGNSVFYNPVQEFNRDLTIAVILEFIKDKINTSSLKVLEYSKEEASSVVNIEENSDNCEYIYPGEKYENGVSILEALSASGLRSVRFAKELPGLKRVVANDFSEDAYNSIKRNINHNNVGNVVEANVADATLLMYENRGPDAQYDIVDLDPYGSATKFLDPAVQAVRPGGLLCVTCTDMAVFAGNCPDACWSKYHSIPLKTKAVHEQALRILLQAISTSATRHSRYIEPLISVSVDFYIRVYVRVHHGAQKANLSASKHINVYRCGGCSTFHTNPVAQIVQKGKGKATVPNYGPPVGPTCEHCNHRHKMGGPYWGDRLHDFDFARRVLNSVKNFRNRYGAAERIIGMLSMITEELPDTPFYYVTDELSSVLRCSAPSASIIKSAILNANYKVSSFHGRKNSIKTDVPPLVLWDIMRKWAETQDIKKEKLLDTSAAKIILEKPITTEGIDLTERKDAEPESKTKGVTRFPELPAFWGPKARAKVNSEGVLQLESNLQERSKKYQGKRRGPRSKRNNKKAKMPLPNESSTEKS